VRLRYTLQALADLDAILEHIDEKSPRGAMRVKGRVEAIIDLLLLHPLVGATTDDPSIRRMITRPYPYLVFYEATENELIAHAIRHAARDPSSMPG
jgi:plasmid stabilization system protein ParE